MTRLLSRIWSDPESGASNERTASLFDYHQATKHSYHSVRMNARSLDWKNQPNPFRTYQDAPVIALPPNPGFRETGAFAAMAALGVAMKTASPELPGDQPAQLDARWVSRLLWHSMAVSAWKKVLNSSARYSLRVNPSSGNLHPTETYLALNGFIGIENGLYHYRPDRHALELRSRGAWTGRLARELSPSEMSPQTRTPPLIVALTSIFWREAWKYGERAYRYCCHDLGHAMMSVLLAAQALGLSGSVVAHFSDLRMSRALGLAESDEAPMAFLVFFPHRGPGAPATPAEPLEIPDQRPNLLSPEEVGHELILGIHRSTILPDPPGPLPRPAADSAAPATGPRSFSLSSSSLARDSPLGPVVRRRRSALDFDPATAPLERRDAVQLLEFATRDWPADWRGNSGGATPVPDGADFVTLYLYLHRVRDCAPGVYRWDRLERELQQLHQGNVERVAAFLSLEQSLAGNACFAVSMIANLGEAARVFGNRGYRYVHFEAGAIGQRLYVGAEALGWNATGIGAFYDDDVHRYLGLLDEGEGPTEAAVRQAEQTAPVMLGSPASRAAVSPPGVNPGSASEPGRVNQPEAFLPRDPRTLPQQVVYHFAVGRAIADPRLEG